MEPPTYAAGAWDPSPAFRWRANWGKHKALRSKSQSLSLEPFSRLGPDR
jgi:hypothetical protein